jgi:REP element-mobilizing transposase RayT
MPRPVRRQFVGAIYHVINRGDRREEIFRDAQDRRLFLATLTEACRKTQWQIHAYCLMRNHFHLVLETPQPNLVYGMKWLLGVYTKRFNIRHKECGHLFAGRYKALHVQGSGKGYFDKTAVARPRGYAWAEIDPSVGKPLRKLEIQSNPRRPVVHLRLDCTPFGNKLKDGAAALETAACKLITENSTPSNWTRWRLRP